MRVTMQFDDGTAARSRTASVTMTLEAPTKSAFVRMAVGLWCSYERMVRVAGAAKSLNAVSGAAVEVGVR